MNNKTTRAAAAKTDWKRETSTCSHDSDKTTKTTVKGEGRGRRQRLLGR